MIYPKYIIELSTLSISLAGQLAHIHLKAYPKNKAGQLLLNELIQQTDIVYRDSAYHAVYTTLEAPPDTVVMPEVWHVPLLK